MPSPAETVEPRYLAAGMPEVPSHDRWLARPEAERLAGLAYTKRREEARLGRWAAKRAVAHALARGVASASLRELVIRNAPDGAPEVFVDEVPAPLRISMTDRADWAVCTVLVGGQDDAGGIGCDLELVEPRSARFVADWFTARERSLVAAGEDHDLLANLVWSAKESALKVLRTGLRRDTRSVEVQLDDERERGWNALRVRSVEGEVFPGWWRQAGAFVLTFAAAHPTPPPVPFVEPCPLDAAEPAHSWMASPLTPGSRAGPAPLSAAHTRSEPPR